uniref:Cell division cycle protein 123 n=1 Tax=Lotharella oceanica TaxID=641309 RepID=A0A7S2TRW3_9EUKA
MSTDENETDPHTIDDEEDSASDACRLISMSQSLSTLIKRIDSVLSKSSFDGQPFFAKLDTRSPKDALLYNPRVLRYRRMVEGELAKASLTLFMPCRSQRALDREMTLGFIRAQNRALKLQKGQEALELFVRSFRIPEDLRTMMQHGEKHFDGKLVLRKWDDWAVDHPEAEFRCFVHKGKLTAATQYFTSCFFPEVYQRRKAIAEQIQRFFNETVRDRLSATHESYVIDFLVRSPTWDDVQVIELNAYEVYTGAGLFSWSKDRDVLMNGPFELRVLESEPDVGREQFIAKRWMPVVDEHIEFRRLTVLMYVMTTVIVFLAFLAQKLLGEEGIQHVQYSAEK